MTTPPSTEDKHAWCAIGEAEEQQFVNSRLPALNLHGTINPAKLADKYAHDLLIQIPADLKAQRTPLFLARELFNLDPQFAVTFNDKDGVRYSRLYPNILIVFDVRWTNTSKEIGGKLRTVEPIHTTRCGFLADVRRAIMEDGCRHVTYKRRLNDGAGNARRSWVFDVRRLAELTTRPPARP